MQFLSSGFVVMLFHYDGIVDEWSDLEWYDHVIHVSAKNQTKWCVLYSLLQVIMLQNFEMLIHSVDYFWFNNLGLSHICFDKSNIDQCFLVVAGGFPSGSCNQM